MSTAMYSFDDPFISTAATTTYDFQEDAVYSTTKRKHQHKKTRSDSSSASGIGSENGSLSYSVEGSSAQNGTNGSSEESSTGSSFAEMMKLIDNEDVASYLRREQLQQGHLAQQFAIASGNSGSGALNNKYGLNTPQYYYATMGRNGGSSRSLGNNDGATVDTRSIAGESLAYSTDMESHALRSLQTDAESALHGADLLSTFTGHNSDAYGNERINPASVGGLSGNNSNHIQSNNSNNNSTSFLTLGNSNNASLLTKDFDYTDENDESADLFNDVLFAPAEYTDGIKRRKEKKRRERREERSKKMQQKTDQQEDKEQPEQAPQKSPTKAIDETPSTMTIPSSTTDATIRVKNVNNHADKTNRHNNTDDDTATGDTRTDPNSVGTSELPSSGATVETSSFTTALPPQSGNSSAYTAVPPSSQESSVSSNSASPVRSDKDKNEIITRTVHDPYRRTPPEQNANIIPRTTKDAKINATPSSSPANLKTQSTSPIKSFASTTAIETEKPDETPIPWWMSCFPDSFRGIISTNH